MRLSLSFSSLSLFLSSLSLQLFSDTPCHVGALKVVVWTGSSELSRRREKLTKVEIVTAVQEDFIQYGLALAKTWAPLDKNVYSSNKIFFQQMCQFNVSSLNLLHACAFVHSNFYQHFNFKIIFFIKPHHNIKRN